jgi:hypothetical protein
LTGTIWSINAKPRSHVKFGLIWLDCVSQIRTKLANLWGIFDQILKNDLFDAWSFWFQKLSPWHSWAIKAPMQHLCLLSTHVKSHWDGYLHFPLKHLQSIN